MKSSWKFVVNSFLNKTVLKKYINYYSIFKYKLIFNVVVLRGMYKGYWNSGNKLLKKNYLLFYKFFLLLRILLNCSYIKIGWLLKGDMLSKIDLLIFKYFNQNKLNFKIMKFYIYKRFTKIPWLGFNGVKFSIYNGKIFCICSWNVKKSGFNFGEFALTKQKDFFIHEKFILKKKLGKKKISKK